MSDDDPLTTLMVETVTQGSYIKATPAISKRANKPRKYDSDRTCAQGYCTTRLSQYNKGPYCYSHSPVKQPRVRGRFLDE